MSCPPVTMACRWRSANTTRSASCPSQKIWRRLRKPGNHIAAWLAGICGGVWTSKRFDHRGHRGHTGHRETQSRNLDSSLLPLAVEHAFDAVAEVVDVEIDCPAWFSSAPANVGEELRLMGWVDTRDTFDL